MAIPFAVIWPILAQAGKGILEIPVIHRGIENWFKGTRTPLDDILWNLFERVGGIQSPTEQELAVLAAAKYTQEVHDVAKAEAIPVADAARSVAVPDILTALGVG